VLNITTATKGWFGGNKTDRQAQPSHPQPPQSRPRIAPAGPRSGPAISQPTHTDSGSLEKETMTEPAYQADIKTMPGQVAFSTPAVPETQPPLAQPAYLSSSEAALIGRAQAGDQTAFAELVELHQDFVYNLAYRILQNEEEADDATQEAFVKIWQALPGFRGESKFTTWAYRIVRNGCLNRLRSNKSNPRLVSVETNFEQGEEEGREIIANLPGSETDEPSWRFDTQERRLLIWQQVDGLPIKYREIIGLYYQQELSYEEIAASLEVPVGTVKTHLYRAKALLKSKLLELNTQGVLDFGF
jgi:RNA polymerase sigma-70 factor, ECF subfamily